MTAPNPKAIHELGPVVLASENHIGYKGRFLMHRRSEAKSRFPGYLIGPGGRIDEGEDVITAAAREINEETGLKVSLPDIHLKVVAIHHHLDRGEVWVNFITLVMLSRPPGPPSGSDDGTSEWVKLEDLMAQDKVFQPSKIYFDHVLNDRPGIMYTNSQWRNAELVRQLSQTVVIQGEHQ